MQALLRQPDLLLLDEPLSGLDEASQAEMVGLLNETKRLGTAIVMSVHEPLLISSVADRVTRLSRGRIVHEGPPEIRISREEDEMRLEFANVAAHLLSELEEASGFLRWETKGKTGAVIVRASIADDVMLHILQSGGSILGVQRLHERSGAAGVPAQSARKGRSLNDASDPLYDCELHAFLSLFCTGGFYAHLGGLHICLSAQSDYGQLCGYGCFVIYRLGLAQDEFPES